MENKNRKYIGRRKVMEKILYTLGVLGVCLIISGTMVGCAGCKAGLDSQIKENATQIEVVDKDKELPGLEDLTENQVTTKPTNPVAQPTQGVNNSENNVQNKVEIAEKQMQSEALEFWNLSQEELSQCIKNGLQYGEFEKNYLFYRVGLEGEGILDKEHAYTFTMIEVKRLYEVVKGEFDSLDTKSNISYEDGTYKFSDEFIGTISSYEYFEGATQKEINDFLQELAPVIDGLSGKDVDVVLSIYEGNLHAQNQKKAEASKPTPTPEAEKPVDKPAEQKPVEKPVATPTPVVKDEVGAFDGGFDDLIINEDGTRTSPDGSFTFDAPIGGGPHTELPEGFLGFH